MASTFATDGKAGAGFSRRTLTPDFKLGTSAIGDENATWVYVQATGAIAAAAVVVLTVPAFTVATGAGAFTADTAFAIGEYGWVRKTVSPLGNP